MANQTAKSTAKKATAKKTTSRAKSTTAKKRVTAAKKPALTHETIQQKAYEIYLAEGCKQGKDLHHWLKAEQELKNATI